MNSRLGFIAVFTFFVGLIGCVENTKNTDTKIESIYSCDVERMDQSGKHFLENNDNALLFSNTNTRSNEMAHSGEYSSKLYPGKRFGLTTELHGIGPDSYFEVTAWRKSPNKGGVVVVDGGTKDLYEAALNVIEKDDKGWEKLYLEYYVPPNYFSGKLKIYVWNNTSDTVYFDDLQIVHKDKKVYSSYSDYGKLQLHIDESLINTFKQKRFNAFETGLLVNSGDDFVPTVIYDGSNFLNGKVRLKGDLLDHLTGDKWSYRIKLKKEFAWNGMRTFSVQNPSTRHHLYEWIAHKVFFKEDVLTTRYGLIPVAINGTSKGIYAWEEHFEKQLVENKQRREGPIIRFDESLFWNQVLETRASKQNLDIDHFGGAAIIPFSLSNAEADSLQLKQFEEAQTLLNQFKYSEAPISELFDINKMASYYALLDVTQAFHGFTWHNLRFYYNPVTCLLEPIAFDGYIEDGIYKRIDEQVNGLFDITKVNNLSRMDLMLYKPFESEPFRRKYIECLKKYSDRNFIPSILHENKNEIDSLNKMLKIEFPYYDADFSYLSDQTAFIRKNIEEIEKNVNRLGQKLKEVKVVKLDRGNNETVRSNLITYQVQAFYNSDKKLLTVFNYANVPVQILGAFIKDEFPESFDNKPIIGINKSEAESIQLQVSGGTPEKLLFSAGGDMYETKIFQWSAPKKKTSRQKMLSKTNLQDLTIVGDTVIFNGHNVFTTDIVIPDSFKVNIMPGASLDFVKGAGFFCFGSVHTFGTKEEPIVIKSSDNSANGFNLFQTSETSLFRYTNFSGLSNLKHEGWFTPAAVSLYESDVIIENCIFEKNYSCDDALNIVRSDFIVSNSIFRQTFADAFDSDFSKGEVHNCIFENIGNDAIDFSGSLVTISKCKMNVIGDKAISGGEKSELKVLECEINNAKIGLASKDFSKLDVNKVMINDAIYGIVAFVKKPEYGPVTITIDNLKVKRTNILHQIEKGSVLILNGKPIEGREEKLATKLYQ